VSTRSQGFGVEPAQLQLVGRQYSDEAGEISAIKDTVVTNVGEGQVGRHFRAVAAPYRQAFEQFGRNLDKFAAHTTSIGGRVNEAGATYARTDDANRRRIGRVH
jgi:uncharacterized protein YukE